MTPLGRNNQEIRAKENQSGRGSLASALPHSSKPAKTTPLPHTQKGKQLQGRERPKRPTATRGCCLTHLLTASGRHASRSDAVLRCPPTGTPRRLPVRSVARHAGSGVSGAPPLQELAGKALLSAKGRKQTGQRSPPASKMLLMATVAAARCVSGSNGKGLRTTAPTRSTCSVFLQRLFVKMNV